MSEEVSGPAMPDEDIEALVNQIRADEAGQAELGEIDVSFAEISGFDEEELQRFLEEKAGVTAASGVQQSVIGFAATVAVHC